MSALWVRGNLNIRPHSQSNMSQSAQEPRTQPLNEDAPAEIDGHSRRCVFVLTGKFYAVTAVQSLWQQTGHSGECGYEFWVQRTDPCMVK